MEKVYNFDNIILGLVLFTLPISMKLNSLMVIIASLFFIYKTIKTKQLNSLKAYYISFIFFVAQLFSFLMSKDIVTAQKALVLQLSFLLFPICFSFFLKGKKLTYTVFNYLFYGVLVVLFYGAIRFSYDAFYLGERYDYGRGVELLLKYVPHHVYLSIYILISIYFVIEEYIENKRKNIKLYFVPFLYLFLILLTSRMAMILAIVVLPIILVFRLQNKINKKGKLLLFFIMLLIVIIGFTNEFSRDKIVFAYYELAEIANPEKSFNGISQRKQVWQIVVQKIKESPFLGYGIGDSQAVLHKAYIVKKAETLIGLNAHNQYFEWLLHYGVIITLILIFFILKLLKKCWNLKLYFLLFSWLVILSFCLTESILNRQWGVIIFAFMLNFTSQLVYRHK